MQLRRQQVEIKVATAIHDEKKCVGMGAHACMHACVCVYVCVFVLVRERDRERDRESECVCLLTSQNYVDSSFATKVVFVALAI